VRRARTTICCRSSPAIALAALLSGAVLAQSIASEPRLFPVRAAWTLPLNNALVAPPVFTATHGYFPIEGERLAAYDVVGGSLLWIAKTKTRSQPAAGDSLIFVVEPDALTAVRDGDGTVAWRLPFADPLATPLVWNTGWLVATTTSGSVLAFRASDGQLIWRHEAGARAHTTPSFGGDRVYIPLDDSRVVALDVNDGHIVWERRLGGPANEVLGLDDRIYVGSNDNFLYCLRATDGQVDWRWRTGADVVGMPVADEHRVYFVSFDNVLRALDRRSGAQRWKRGLPLRPTRGITRAADTLLVSGAAARVSAYNMKDGSPAGDVTAAGELACAPHVVTADTAGLPMVVVVGRDLVKGTILSAMIRSMEPATAPVAPLPNPIAVPATLTPEARPTP
jgi:outer membrane protein assembly factor BamB